MCPAGDQKSERKNPLLFFSDVHLVAANPFTLLIFKAEKAHCKVKTNFLFRAAPYFFTSRLGFG